MSSWENVLDLEMFSTFAASKEHELEALLSQDVIRAERALKTLRFATAGNFLAKQLLRNESKTRTVKCFFWWKKNYIDERAFLYKTWIR